MKNDVMRQLVAYFVDGSEVDLVMMRVMGLIQKEGNGFVLTPFGKSLCRR